MVVSISENLFSSYTSTITLGYARVTSLLLLFFFPTFLFTLVFTFYISPFYSKYYQSHSFYFWHHIFLSNTHICLFTTLEYKEWWSFYETGHYIMSNVKIETRISKRTINERNEKNPFLSFIYVAKKNKFWDSALSSELYFTLISEWLMNKRDGLGWHASKKI